MYDASYAPGTGRRRPVQPAAAPQLPCSSDPELFFADSPQDVLAREGAVRCLPGAVRVPGRCAATGRAVRRLGRRAVPARGYCGGQEAARAPAQGGTGRAERGHGGQPAVARLPRRRPWVIRRQLEVRQPPGRAPQNGSGAAGRRAGGVESACIGAGYGQRSQQRPLSGDCWRGDRRRHGHVERRNVEHIRRPERDLLGDLRGRQGHPVRG